MKPILHIVKNRNDKQALEIISTQAKDNAYGVAVVFIHDAVSSPPVADVRTCALAQDPKTSDNITWINPEVELISCDDLLKLIFSVESITMW
ncbi:MAG TPA: hypothetical protein VFF47_06815 [Nitrospirota bacterium]|nr:hypothetical protein [Nitrospirota bacterium]